MKIHIFAAIFLCTNMGAFGSALLDGDKKMRALLKEGRNKVAALACTEGKEVTDFEELEREIISQLEREKKKSDSKDGKG